MSVLARPSSSGVSATWAAIKAALARAIKRGVDARMTQIRREIEIYRVHRSAPPHDGAPASR
jgi:hypothetical protein